MEIGMGVNRGMELCYPQLGIAVRSQGDEVILFRTTVLRHQNRQYKGVRHFFVFSTDDTISSFN